MTADKPGALADGGTAAMDVDAATAQPIPALKNLESVARRLRQSLPLLIKLKQSREEGAKTESSPDVSNADVASSVERTSLLLVELKSLSQSARIAAQKWKDRVKAIKKTMEAEHLHQQNLLYEKNHLRREIKRCRDFDMKEFSKLEMDNGFTVEDLQNANHESQRGQVERLMQELAMRKRLIERLKEITEQKDTHAKEIETTEQFLSSLPEILQNIEKATAPLQSHITLPVSDRLRKQEEAQKLPGPLYTLYTQLEGYKDVHGQLELKVVLNEGAAEKKRFLPPSSPSASSKKGKYSHGSATMAQEEGQDRARAAEARGGARVTAETVVCDWDAFFAADSARLQVKISCDFEKPLCLTFSYMPECDTVAVETKGYEGILNALFPGDYGCELSVSARQRLLALCMGTREEPSQSNELEQRQRRPPQPAIVDTKSNAFLENGAMSEGSTSGGSALGRTKLEGTRLVGGARAEGSVLANSTFGSGSVGGRTHRCAETQRVLREAERELRVRAAGRVFHWAQWVCGRYQLPSTLLGPGQRAGEHALGSAPRTGERTLGPRSSSAGSSAPQQAAREKEDASRGAAEAEGLSGAAEGRAEGREEAWKAYDEELSFSRDGLRFSRSQVPFRLEPSVRAVVHRIQSRVKSYIALRAQLSALSSLPHPIPSHPSAASAFLPAPSSRLASWEEISASEKPLFFARGEVQEGVRRGSRFFKATFKREKDILHAGVEIRPDYPDCAPRVLLQPRHPEALTESVSFDFTKKAIERELNAHYDELVTQDTFNWVLLHQLRKLQMCMDIVHQPELEAGMGLRGRDRRPALVLDPVTRSLVHR